MTNLHENLFDYQKGLELKEKGVKQVEKNTDPKWKELAVKSVETLASSGKAFTSDDVWQYLDGLATTPQPKAIGAVFLSAYRKGLIKPNGEFWQSKRPQAHGRRLMVWTGVQR